jgi:hypothetical protein
MAHDVAVSDALVYLNPRPEPEIAGLTPDTGEKLLLSSLPSSLSAVLSRFAINWITHFKRVIMRV